MKELDLTVGRGTGIPKIRRFMGYNGSPEPVFETDADGNYFLTILKLHKDAPFKVSTEQGLKSGTKSQTEGTAHFAGQVAGQVTGQVAGQVIDLMKVCEKEQSKKELMNKLGLLGRDNFEKLYLKPAIKNEFLEMTIPEKPKSRMQKYRLTEKGRKLLDNEDQNNGN